MKTLALYGSTPGLKNSHALTWIPKVKEVGLKKFLADTIDERFDSNAEPELVKWFIEQAGSNDPAFIARFVTHMTTHDFMDEVGKIKVPHADRRGGQGEDRACQRLRRNAQADRRFDAEALRHRRPQHLRRLRGPLRGRPARIPQRAALTSPASARIRAHSSNSSGVGAPSGGRVPPVAIRKARQRLGQRDVVEAAREIAALQLARDRDDAAHFLGRGRVVFRHHRREEPAAARLRRVLHEQGRDAPSRKSGARPSAKDIFPNRKYSSREVVTLILSPTRSIIAA